MPISSYIAVFLSVSIFIMSYRTLISTFSVVLNRVMPYLVITVLSIKLANFKTNFKTKELNRGVFCLNTLLRIILFFEK